MGATGQDFAERWQSVVRNLQDRVERLQATADGIPPDLHRDADPDPGGSFTRHVEAFADYAVALNCLHALVAERTGGREMAPSVQSRQENTGMARYHCRACGFNGQGAWRGELSCPVCGDGTAVGVALDSGEMAIPVVVAEASGPIGDARPAGGEDRGRSGAVHLADWIRNRARRMIVRATAGPARAGTPTRP